MLLARRKIGDGIGVALVLAGSLAGATAALGAAPRCDAILFVGQLRWAKLYPRSVYVTQEKAPNGNLQITTTNSCGRAETKFNVTRILVGPSLSSLIVTSDLGEDCKPPVRLSRAPMLISAEKEKGKWVLEGVAPVSAGKALMERGCVRKSSQPRQPPSRADASSPASIPYPASQ